MVYMIVIRNNDLIVRRSLSTCGIGLCTTKIMNSISHKFTDHLWRYYRRMNIGQAMDL